MRYLPMILGAGLLTERRITCGLRPSPRRHAHARVGSFRCRGHGGRKGCLLTHRRYARRSYRRGYYGHGYSYGYQRPYYGYGYRRPYYGYGYGRRWRY